MVIGWCCAVNIKWGKEKFEDVHCNTDEPPLVFKATLFSLSGVQPDRQKVMFKGVVIKVSRCSLTLQNRTSVVGVLWICSSSRQVVVVQGITTVIFIMSCQSRRCRLALDIILWSL